MHIHAVIVLIQTLVFLQQKMAWHFNNEAETTDSLRSAAVGAVQGFGPGKGHGTAMIQSTNSSGSDADKNSSETRNGESN